MPVKKYNGTSWDVVAGDGSAGAAGTNGQGVPVGGTAGQVLSKIDSTNYNTQWVAQSGGGSAGDSDQTILPTQIFG
jgi:hypothetical protein